ncbi:MAG: protein kinase [Acidobacteriota bacterium]|nr:MAG: protein kinase [Acidobacteriota bacterium]
MRYCQACQRCFGDRVEFCLIDQTATRLVPSLPLVIDQKYRLEQLIAHGGMGSVYRASHLTLDRPVAIKILRPEYLDDPTIRERFSREAKAVARLKHPNVVSIYDYGLLPGDQPDRCGAYLVMEFIEGLSLRRLIRGGEFREGAQGVLRATEVMTQICAGVGAAHRQGIVHRDLKPDNIMIEPALHGAERVLVLDFGIAKLRDREQVWQGLTDEDMIIGTPNYISPEQCSGHEVDHRSDVYSLGVMLFEMLTSTTPFAASNTSAILLRHMQEAPPPVRRFRPDIGDGFEEVLSRALEKNPDRRFGSAAELAREFALAVESYLRSVENETTLGEPVFEEFDEVSPPEQLFTTSATLVRGDRRSRTFSLAVFSVVLAILATGIYFWSLDWKAWAVDDVPSSTVHTEEKAPPEKKNLAGKSARNPAQGVQKTASSDRTPGAAGDVPDHTLRELRSVYNDWTASAIRGDWKRHIGLYAGRVDYFRDGNLSRSKVESRKRRIFSGVDAYHLRFSEKPSIRLRKSGELADVTFQRRWTLRRGKKRVEGRARGMLTMRRDPAGWRIVSEKQIGK